MRKFIFLLIASFLFAMNAQAQINSKITSVINPTCPQDSNGSAAVKAFGGTPPYTYLWEPSGQTTDTAVGLLASIIYTITVTDAVLDTGLNYVTLSSVSTLTASTSSVDVSCFGGNNGMASVLPIGGNPPYQVIWLPTFQNTDTITNLLASTYTSQVTDAAGCQVSTAVPVQQPPQLQLTAAAIGNLIQSYATGGTQPYTYQWTPSVSSTSFATGLSPGTYSITVNDANLCTNSTLVSVDSTIITFSLSNISVSCSEGWVSFNIMASSNIPTYFNSGVIDMKYTGAKFSGDSIWGNSVFINFLLPYYPWQTSNPSDSVIQLTISDTTYTPLNETLLDSVPKEIAQGGFMIQNPCQPGTIGFTNQISTSPTNYYTLYTKVFNYADTVSVKTVDSLYNPHICDSLCNPYNCNKHCCQYDLNNSCTDSCYSICYNECPYTCYDTAWKSTQTVDSIFTTYTKNFAYNNAIYSSGNILIDTACPPFIDDFYTAPMDAGVGDILTISGGGFGPTRGTGRVEFIDADTSNYYIKAMNSADYIKWATNEIRIRLPAYVDSIYTNKRIPLTVGGGNFKVVNSCGDSAVSGKDDEDKYFSIFYNIKQLWNPSDTPSQKTEIFLRRTDDSGGYTLRFDSVTFPKGSIQRKIFVRAMKDWTCYTGMNWRVGKDTSFVYNPTFPPPYINYVFMTNNPLIMGPNDLGATNPTDGTCDDSINALLYASIYFRSTAKWLYDTTGKVPVGADTADFYGTCLHEQGHFIELNHTTGQWDLMYYAANNGYIDTAHRLTLDKVFSAGAVAGGIYSVEHSASATGVCEFGAIQPAKDSYCVNPFSGVQPISGNEKNSPTFVVYPNPSNGTFTIATNINDYTLVVMNMLGQIIFTRKVHDEKTVINLSTEANGMYFVQEQYKNGITTQKLIITKK